MDKRVKAFARFNIIEFGSNPSGLIYMSWGDNGMNLDLSTLVGIGLGLPLEQPSVFQKWYTDGSSHRTPSFVKYS